VPLETVWVGFILADVQSDLSSSRIHVTAFSIDQQITNYCQWHYLIQWRRSVIKLGVVTVVLVTSPFLLISFFPFSFYRSLPGPPLPLIQHCKLSSGSRQSQAVEHILMHFTFKNLSKVYTGPPQDRRHWSDMLPHVQRGTASTAINQDSLARCCWQCGNISQALWLAVAHGRHFRPK